METALVMIAGALGFFLMLQLHDVVKTIMNGKVKIAEARRDEARADADAEKAKLERARLERDSNVSQ